MPLSLKSRSLQRQLIGRQAGSRQNAKTWVGMIKSDDTGGVPNRGGPPGCVLINYIGTPGKATGNDENWKGNKWQFETRSLPGFRNPSVRPLSLYVGAVHRPETASKDKPETI